LLQINFVTTEFRNGIKLNEKVLFDLFAIIELIIECMTDNDCGFELLLAFRNDARLILWLRLDFILFAN
jgi:hypothetical protein